jgi:raffinose/stachyose/melibiose transport system permease protein
MATSEPRSPAARRRGGGRRVTAGSVARQSVLLAFTALALFPIYFMVASAFKTNDEFAGNQLGIPHHFVLSTLRAALAGGDIYRWLGNSVLVTASAVLISTALATLCAYPLSVLRWRPGRALLNVFIALMVIPPIVLIIPLFSMVSDLHQLNTFRAVIAIYTGIMLPFSTFLLTSFFRTLPPSLIEAARIDGAGSWRVLRSIVVPLSLPALMTVVIVQALWVWNEVLIAVIFLQQDSLRTLMVGLTVFKSRYHIDIPIVMAGMVWATIPMVALYLAGQRFFIRGLTAGSTKG